MESQSQALTLLVLSFVWDVKHRINYCMIEALEGNEGTEGTEGNGSVVSSEWRLSPDYRFKTEFKPEFK